MQQSMIAKSLKRLFEHGPRNLWDRVHAYIYDAARERSLGIETASWLEWMEVVSDRNCMNYEPLAYWYIEQILTAMPLNPGVDVFLDYGSGKGRAVISAALLPFRRVIGVELIDELSAIANNNIDRAGALLKCKSTSVVTTNAADYRLPSDVTHIFLFNPFHGTVLQAVLRQIRNSWRQHQRRITIAYILPPETENPLSRCDWLEPPRQLPLTHWQGLLFLVYNTVGDPDRINSSGPATN